MKQTAVELLKQRLIKDQQVFPIYNEYINGILYDINNELLEMEKQHIIDARVNGVAEGIEISDKTITEDISKNHEQYYNETYKNE